jgi:hypothetical protein
MALADLARRLLGRARPVLVRGVAFVLRPIVEPFVDDALAERDEQEAAPRPPVMVEPVPEGWNPPPGSRFCKASFEGGSMVVEPLSEELGRAWWADPRVTRYCRSRVGDGPWTVGVSLIDDAPPALRLVKSEGLQ